MYKCCRYGTAIVGAFLCFFMVLRGTDSDCRLTIVRCTGCPALATRWAFAHLCPQWLSLSNRLVAERASSSQLCLLTTTFDTFHTSQGRDSLASAMGRTARTNSACCVRVPVFPTWARKLQKAIAVIMKHPRFNHERGILRPHTA